MFSKLRISQSHLINLIYEQYFQWPAIKVSPILESDSHLLSLYLISQRKQNKATQTNQEKNPSKNP